MHYSNPSVTRGQKHTHTHTPGVIILGIDLAIFYLNTPLPNYEYMLLCLDIIPEEVVFAYNLHNIVKPDGWVYI
jgi:hypothetical protein